MRWIIGLVLILFCSNCAMALPTPKKTTLSWLAPTTNVDGSPLTDLGGYKLYWSTISGVYSDADSRDLGNILLSSIPLNLTGTYYFVVTAYDIAGNESEFSNEVKTNLFRGIKPLTIEIK